MASGVAIKKECKDRYEELKNKHMHGYIIYKISKDCKEIEVDCVGDKNASFEEFCGKLKDAGDDGQGRYAVIDCHYNPGKTSKIVFLTWLNDNTLSIKQKMLYTSSKKAFMDTLRPPVELQCNDLDDFAWSTMVAKCQSKYE